MNFKFLGWAQEGTHDKIWGVILLEASTINYGLNRALVSDWPTETKCATFWGRRGKKLQTKITVDDWHLYRLIQTKIDKGYQAIDQTKLNEVYPEFENDLELTAIMAMLKK